ncbi:hypothetical protein TNCV_715421 [Trichonephila clavipes]|nr:hypothetical protein TNCV_715421 [Trichonephila clavipes]
MSSGTVSKIIRKYLRLKRMLKSKIRLILQEHIAPRKTNRRELYEKHLIAEKWKSWTTLVAAWICSNDCNKENQFSTAQQAGMTVRNGFVKRFIIVAGFCYNC